MESSSGGDGVCSAASTLQSPFERDHRGLQPPVTGGIHLNQKPPNNLLPAGGLVHAVGSHAVSAPAVLPLVQLYSSRSDANGHEQPFEEELHGRSKLFRVTSVPEQCSLMPPPPPPEKRDCGDVGSACPSGLEHPSSGGAEPTTLLPTLSSLTNGLSTHAEEKEDDEETGERNTLLPPKSEPTGVSDRRRRLGTANPPAPLLWQPQESAGVDGSAVIGGGGQDRRSPDGSRDVLPTAAAGAAAAAASPPSSSSAAVAGAVASGGPAKKERRPSITFAPPSVIPIGSFDDEDCDDHNDDYDYEDASGGGSVTTTLGGVGSSGGGATSRVHYRKQRNRQVRSGSAEPTGVTAGFGSSDGPPRASGRGRSQSLLLPPITWAAADGSGRPTPSPPRSPNSRNISTLSLTMLLRDQRRKNLAMLARLFAARQREKDFMEGVPDANEPVTAAATDSNKRRRCRRFGLMEAAMVVLFCSLVSIVTASLLLFDPKRNEALHKRPGFTLDKDKALLVLFDGRGRELKVRVGVGSAGPRYSCLVEASAHHKGGTASPLQPNCVRWQAERATLDVALSAADEAITCVDVHWTWREAPPPSATVTDCVDLRVGGAAWYGGADSSALPWTLNGGGVGGRSSGRLFYAAGAPDVGPVAEKLWLSDGGHLVAEMSDGCGDGGGEARAATSLYVELADNGSSLCLSDSPSYRQRYGPGKRLTYVACVARDARAAHSWLTRRRLNASSAVPNGGHLDSSGGVPPAMGGDEAEEDDEKLGASVADGGGSGGGDDDDDDAWASPDDLVKADPIWTLPASGAADYVQRIGRYGFSHSALLLDDNALLMTADELARRLAAVAALLPEANRTAGDGARLGVVVSPAVGIGSELALGRLHEPLWFSSQPDDLPLLMHHSASSRASVLLNLTRPLARHLVVDKLLAAAATAAAPPADEAATAPRNSSWRIALLVLADAGAASVMALEHHSEVRQESIAEFAASYRGLRRDLTRAGLALDYRVDGGPVPLPSPPLRRRDGGGGVSPFVYMFPPSVRRRSACSLLAHLLAASVAGHAAIDVGPFGGGDGASANVTSAERRRAYASWLQLAALSSAVHFGQPPWLAAGGDSGDADGGVDDDDTVRLAHRLLELRRSVVAPRLRSALRAHASDGTPVYRPLWWDGAPAANASGTRKAAAAAAATTQFFIDDVLFAPTCDGRKRRNVFIPRGYWQDATGELFIGPDIFSYSPVADCPLPFFVERPVGTT